MYTQLYREIKLIWREDEINAYTRPDNKCIHKAMSKLYTLCMNNYSSADSVCNIQDWPRSNYKFLRFLFF